MRDGRGHIPISAYTCIVTSSNHGRKATDLISKWPGMTFDGNWPKWNDKECKVFLKHIWHIFMKQIMYLTHLGALVTKLFYRWISTIVKKKKETVMPVVSALTIRSVYSKRQYLNILIILLYYIKNLKTKHLEVHHKHERQQCF